MSAAVRLAPVVCGKRYAEAVGDYNSALGLMAEAEELDEEEEQNAFYSRGLAQLELSRQNRELQLPGAQRGSV